MREPNLISRARGFGDRIAVRSGDSTYCYQTLVDRATAVAANLLGAKGDLQESRIAFRISPGFQYVAAQWGIWLAGGVAVPLSLSATESELAYTLGDCDPVCVITDERTDQVDVPCGELCIPVLAIEELCDGAPAASLPELNGDRRAMILYTSGTTSRPKGVVTTHGCIEAQIESLVDAWHWEREDRIPLFLPLHHIHGIINILSCALWCGAEVETLGRFEMDVVLRRIGEDAYTLFMAVPTIYVKLIQSLESMNRQERERVIHAFGKLRLMVSGSAALPASVHQRWTELTGQILLERYGMTEIGMAISNPYLGERRPGAVGQPLPGVEVRLQSEQGDVIGVENEPGEIQVRGKNVFLEYWRKEEATLESFQEGWFRTGDVAVMENGYYRIMGRTSVDIIKSGGYKLSALEIEACLLDHPSILECAVIGLPDETWGEVVAAAVVLVDGHSLSVDAIREWSDQRLSAYKIPRRLLCVESLPRNAMGKVTKPDVASRFSEVD